MSNKPQKFALDSESDLFSSANFSQYHLRRAGGFKHFYMNNFYRQLTRPLTPAALTCFLLIFIGACSSGKIESGKVEAANNLSTESKDTEIGEALKLIEKIPDSPTGYVRLAAVYIKRARAGGDFCLNSKAETAVDKALQLAPEDVPARKLKASLCLTF